jgi:small-conductance mechanosensitive channel
MTLLDQLIQLSEAPFVGESLRAIVILLVAWILFRFIRSRVESSTLSAQHQLLARRGLGYLIFGLFAAWAMSQYGLSISVLLGAAGVLTVALGFAAQTSVSNIISGAFLIAEQPFLIGDIIKVGDTSGEVVSIDLLSIKMRTFDNLLVRIPNESMLKSNLTNLTHFPIRRFDLKVGVAFKEDLSKVQRVLLDTARGIPICLQEPEPLIIILGFGESSVDLQFSVWAKRENFLDLRNTMHRVVKEAFDREGVEIPYPHRR